MEKHVREDIVDRLVFDRDPFGASYSAFDTRHGYILLLSPSSIFSDLSAAMTFTPLRTSPSVMKPVPAPMSAATPPVLSEAASLSFSLTRSEKKLSLSFSHSVAISSK